MTVTATTPLPYSLDQRVRSPAAAGPRTGAPRTLRLCLAFSFLIAFEHVLLEVWLAALAAKRVTSRKQGLGYTLVFAKD